MNVICPLYAGLLLDPVSFALDNKEEIMWEISWLFNNSPGKNSEANSGDKRHLCREEQSVSGYGKSHICVCAIHSPYPKLRSSDAPPKSEISQLQPTPRQQSTWPYSGHPVLYFQIFLWVKQRKSSKLCLWILFSLLVSSSVLFTSAAHLSISSPGLLWVVLVTCLVLCIASHIPISMSPWARILGRLFIYIFCFFIVFLNVCIQWEAGARLWLQIIFSYEPRNSQKVLPTEFSNMSWCPPEASFSLLGCHMENLSCFVPWEIWLLVASKFCLWWLGKPDHVIWRLY